MTNPTPTEVIESAYEAILGRGDIDSFLNHFADNAVMIEAESLPYGGTYTGKEQIRAGLNKVFPFYRFFSFKPDVLTANGEWVIAYGEFSITSASTGNSIAFPLAEVSRVVDGKIVMIHPVYSDTKALLDVLGL